MDRGLELRGLTLAAGGRTLAEGLDATLGDGERIAVRGPSGAGKTTLLRAVAALDPWTAGEVTLDDRTPDQWGVPAYRRRVVYIHQRPTVLPGSVGDNLGAPFEYEVAGETALDEGRARDLLERLGIPPERWDDDASKMSEGEQQRVCLVRALLVEPRFLLLDEPTSALDPESVRRVEELIDDLGLGGLVVTHDEAQAERFCSGSLAIGGDAGAG